MKSLTALVCVCLVASALCSSDVGPDSDKPEENSRRDDADHHPIPATTEGYSETPSTEFPSTKNNVHEEGTSSYTDNPGDQIITAPKDPGDETATDENLSTTVDGFETSSADFSTVVGVDDPSETNRSACFENPCQNGAQCRESPSLPAGFSCECPEGYVGARCQTTDECVEKHGAGGELCENGYCSYSGDGLARSCRCFAGSFWDNAARECRELTSACDSSPCANGGQCNLLPDGRYNCTCQSGFSGKTCEIRDRCVTDNDCRHGACVILTRELGKATRSCQCDDGFYLDEEERTCREITSPCDPKPCKNGGTCHELEGNRYNCTCEAGFSGEKCQVTDWCSADEDCGQGVCVLAEENGIRGCRCNEGFYLEEESRKCKNISNVCQPNPCLHDGICTVVSADDFNCTCSEGYSGEKCEVRDMCVMDGGNAYCRRHGTCHNQHQLGIYYCACPDKQYFRYADRMCVEVDLCPLVQCEPNEECVKGECVCKENYERKNDTGKCEPDFCSRRPCPAPGMICEEGTGPTDYKCSCKEGYAFDGKHCNEALCRFPHLNPCSQICSETVDGYQCSCDEEFQLNEDNHTCALKGNNTCSIKTCDKGFCVLKSVEEICICPPGYTEVNGNCTDACSADELAPGICPSDECEMTPNGGFRCKCDGKFQLSGDETTCTVRNTCAENEIGWKQCQGKNAECVRNWGVPDGFTCRCSSGQIEDEDGTCRNPCDIESNQRSCSLKGATCDVDGKGRVQCRCPPYLQLSEKDDKCSRPADVSYLLTLPLDPVTYGVGSRMRRSVDASVDYEKIYRDVRITFEEMFVGFRRANILYCNSTVGYLLCKVELQFEIDHETQVKRLQAEDICLARGNGEKTCLLPPALIMVKERIGRDLVIVPTDPCEASIKEELCGSETTCSSSPHSQDFNCSCGPGFSARRRNYPFGNDRTFVESCKDIDECVEGDPCPRNSECTNTIGSYACACKPGFRNVAEGSSTSAADLKCVEICQPNPCTHGECSRRGDHGFDCKCDAGYRGALCDLEDVYFKQAKVNTIIVGVVLGGILLITFILFAVCVSRLRKQKSLENPGQMLYNSTEMVTPF